MASLLGSLGQVLTPDVVGALGRAVGQDNALVQKGLDVVGPLVLGSLAKKSETTSGLDSIMRMVPQDGGAGFLGNVLGALGQQDPLSSAGLLGRRSRARRQRDRQGAERTARFRCDAAVVGGRPDGTECDQQDGQGAEAQLGRHREDAAGGAQCHERQRQARGTGDGERGASASAIGRSVSGARSRTTSGRRSVSRRWRRRTTS